MKRLGTTRWPVMFSKTSRRCAPFRPPTDFRVHNVGMEFSPILFSNVPGKSRIRVFITCGPRAFFVYWVSILLIPSYVSLGKLLAKVAVTDE